MPLFVVLYLVARSFWPNFERVSCALLSHVLLEIPWQEQCFGLGAFQPTSRARDDRKRHRG